MRVVADYVNMKGFITLRSGSMQFKRIISLLFLAGMFTYAIAGNMPGVTETVFNRRFIPTLKLSLSYEQIVKMAGGVPGEKISETKDASVKIVNYRWKGGRNSVLTVKLRDNKMIEATVLAPNGRTYKVQSNGQVTEMPK
jgi:hypothetical protein